MPFLFIQLKFQQIFYKVPETCCVKQTQTCSEFLLEILMQKDWVFWSSSHDMIKKSRNQKLKISEKLIVSVVVLMLRITRSRQAASKFTGSMTILYIFSNYIATE